MSYRRSASMTCELTHQMSELPQPAAGSDQRSTPKWKGGWRTAIDLSLAGAVRDGRRPSAKLPHLKVAKLR